VPHLSTVQLAIECGDVVCRDCAWILENLKQVSDAAMLHEKGGNLERAALLYIKTQVCGHCVVFLPRCLHLLVDADCLAWRAWHGACMC